MEKNLGDKKISKLNDNKNRRLLVLERHVERHDIRVCDALRHVGVPRAVVEHQAAHERRVHVGAVLQGKCRQLRMSKNK